MKLKPNFKVVAVIGAIGVFLMMMYVYNRSQRRKLAQGIAQRDMLQQQPPPQQGMSAYIKPNLGKSGCSKCGKKK